MLASEALVPGVVFCPEMTPVFPMRDGDVVPAFTECLFDGPLTLDTLRAVSGNDDFLDVLFTGFWFPEFNALVDNPLVEPI